MEKVLPRTRVMWKVHRIERKRAKGTQASHNDTENDSKETEINTLEWSRQSRFTLKIPVNIVRMRKCTRTLIMGCTESCSSCL